MAFSVNLTKARNLHIDSIRVIRNRELEKLDADYMKALEADDSSAQTTVKNKKIDLRNMPANVPAVGTFADADAVKAYWPSGGAFGNLPTS
jgi:hypothetical protein|tara:strand:+ start:376 stop:648 length:273 start_codon:yes stop_codon:yes gene_type:complete